MKTLLLTLSVFWCTVIAGNAQHETGCEILSHSRCITLDGNKLVRTDSVSLKIFDQRGEKRTKIQIPYTKGDKVSVHYAYIEDKDVTIVRKIKRNEITDLHYISDMSLYEDDFIKSFELKHNVYPYKVRYAYTITENQYLHVGNLPYTGKDPVREGIFAVSTDRSHPIKYEQAHVGEPQVDSLDGKSTYTWQYRHAYEKPESRSRQEPGMKYVYNVLVEPDEKTIKIHAELSLLNYFNVGAYPVLKEFYGEIVEHFSEVIVLRKK